MVSERHRISSEIPVLGGVVSVGGSENPFDETDIELAAVVDGNVDHYLKIWIETKSGRDDLELYLEFEDGVIREFDNLTGLLKERLDQLNGDTGIISIPGTKPVDEGP